MLLQKREGYDLLTVKTAEGGLLFITGRMYNQKLIHDKFDLLIPVSSLGAIKYILWKKLRFTVEFIQFLS